MLKISGKFVLFILISLLISSGFKTQARENSKLLDRVEKAISFNYGDAAQFDFKLIKGKDIRIEGTVNSLYDKLKIYDIISKVKGVNEISDLLCVNTSDIPDDQIKDDLIINLRSCSSITEPDRIKVNVDNGIVFLSGKVSFLKEKIAAETYSALEGGVEGVVNNITVIPYTKVTADSNIREELTELLKNNFPLDGKVLINVNRGVVVLKGKVSGLWDKNHIVHEFSKVKGVKDIINGLKIVQS